VAELPTGSFVRVWDEGRSMRGVDGGVDFYGTFQRQGC
jgi:hypothetical protein